LNAADQPSHKAFAVLLPAWPFQVERVLAHYLTECGHAPGEPDQGEERVSIHRLIVGISLGCGLLVAAEVESIFEQGFGVETELPEERCHVAMVAAFVEEQMRDELAPAVPHWPPVDVDLVLLAEVGIGPCVEVVLERVAGSAPVRVDLGPGLEVIACEVW